MSRRSIIAMLVALPSLAYAGKPSKAEAKKTAKAWLAALELGDDAPDAKKLAPMTALPFASAKFNDEEALCAATTTTKADALGDVFDCLHGFGSDVAKAKLAPFKKKDMATDWLDRGKDVFALAKTATLVELHTDCAGSETAAVIAIVKDDQGALKVAGVFVQSDTCGE